MGGVVMKARTKICDCEVYFAYEDEYGEKFRNYADLLEDYRANVGAYGRCIGYLTGYLKSHYWGSTERIDEIPIKERPSVSDVKEFMQKCIDIVLS